jgi:sulfur relay (sulfurtransferase) DsrF/TusC family protein
MALQSATRLALIVNSPPYGLRVARANIELALSAAALDFELQLYFLGSSVLQIVAERDTGDALLPPGYRAWAAVPDLADVRVFAETRWLDFCVANGMDLVMPAQSLDPADMKNGWRSCHHVMVI